MQMAWTRHLCLNLASPGAADPGMPVRLCMVVLCNGSVCGVQGTRPPCALVAHHHSHTPNPQASTGNTPRASLLLQMRAAPPTEPRQNAAALPLTVQLSGAQPPLPSTFPDGSPSQQIPVPPPRHAPLCCQSLRTSRLCGPLIHGMLQYLSSQVRPLCVGALLEVSVGRAMQGTGEGSGPGSLGRGPSGNRPPGPGLLLVS